MKKNNFKVRDVLNFEPFLEIIPESNRPKQIINASISGVQVVDNPKWSVITQAEMLRQLFPSGHEILDEEAYKAPMVQVEYSEEYSDGNGNIKRRKRKSWVKKDIARVAVPFQYVIKVSQNIHLCGNNTLIKDSNTNPSESDKELLVKFRQLWLDRNMETCKYRNVNSVNCTGDTATAFYFIKNEKGKNIIQWKHYSYLDGYRLSCQRNPFTNEVELFAAEYTQYDDSSEDRRKVTTFVDVYDSIYLYRFKRNEDGVSSIKNNLLSMLGLEDFTLIDINTHGYPYCPVVYKRHSYGPCWGTVQSLIPYYEKALSQFCDNSKVVGTAMYFIKGGNANVEGMSDGQPVVITSTDPQSDAKIINKSDASDALEKELSVLKKAILFGSFVVEPPEVRSGDLPGVAIKLIYSPSLEKAMEDAHDWNIFVDELVRMFKYGAGIELEKSAQLNNMQITGSIVPYIHQNTAEVVDNICKSKQNGLTSVETGSDSMPFNANDEYSRIKKELKEVQEEQEAGMQALLTNK